MKKIMLIIGILGITFISNAQDHHNKKYSLGQNSVNKWYKLFTIDLNGNGNYNSVNITVNFNYVNTWNKYNSTAIIRLREGPDASHSDWQNSVLGINQSVLKLKKTNTKIYN